MGVSARAAVLGLGTLVGCAFGGDQDPGREADAPEADALVVDAASQPDAAVDGIVVDAVELPPDAVVDARPCTGGDQAIFDPATGHCYLVFNAGRTWQSAHDNCVAVGAHLVTISSATENNLVDPSGSQFRWIGLSDGASEGNFQWVTGEPMTFTNWNGGEPNGGGGENCGGLIGSGRWNDFQCSDSWASVCEFP